MITLQSHLQSWIVLSSMMFVYKILTSCVIFSTFEIPAFIIKNMVEKGSLCFVTSEGSIQNFNMKLQSHTHFTKGSHSWRTKIFTKETIVPKHVWLCGKSLSRFCHLWRFDSKAYQTVPIFQKETKVARLVTEHLSSQSKIAANLVFGSSYCSKTFCKSALGAYTTI
jgi:hypothetical protein